MQHCEEVWCHAQEAAVKAFLSAVENFCAVGIDYIAICDPSNAEAEWAIRMSALAAKWTKGVVWAARDDAGMY